MRIQTALNYCGENQGKALCTTTALELSGKNLVPRTVTLKATGPHKILLALRYVVFKCKQYGT